MMHSDAHSCRLLDLIDDLRAEPNLLLVVIGAARKKPIVVLALHQRRTEVEDILFDQLRQLVIEGKLQRLLVLDVEPRELEPVVALRTSRFD